MGRNRMKATTTPITIALFASIATGQLHESERTLNLKSVQPLFAHAIGKRLSLSVTGQPPEIATLYLPQPTPVRRRDPSLQGRKIQVLLGRDVLGLAELSPLARESLRTGLTTNATKLRVTSILLTFETEEQAARAAEALRLTTVTPRPLQQQKDAK
jgi:hypothetical protein